MVDEELVKMFNPTLKRRETILFFLIVVINGLKCIVSDIRLDTCARERWRVEVPQSKLYCVIHFFILIIFRSIIQFLVVLFPLLLWLHQQIYIDIDVCAKCYGAHIWNEKNAFINIVFLLICEYYTFILRNFFWMVQQSSLA